MAEQQQEFDQELYNQIRATLSPKRKVRTRAAILHNGDLSTEIEASASQKTATTTPAARSRSKEPASSTPNPSPDAKVGGDKGAAS